MSIKPFSEMVEQSVVEEARVKPFIDSPKGGISVEEQLEIHAQQEAGFVIKTVSFLGSFQGVFLSTLFFMFVVLMVDAIVSIQNLYRGYAYLDIFYLFALMILLSALALFSYRNYRDIAVMKSASRHQRAFSAQQALPNKEIVPMTEQLLKYYRHEKSDQFQERAEILKERMSSSHDYSAIYEELDQDVFEVLDVEVQRRIKIASTQAALSTAISPLAVLDAAIVIWRSVRLTQEIAQLYGFKPGWIATVILLRRGAFSVFFAGATELALEYVNAASESTVISKISLSAGQGISNGILLARLGYGVMSACRPLPMRIKRQSFVVSMMGALKEAVVTNNNK